MGFVSVFPSRERTIMALTYSKHIFYKILNKNGTKYLSPVLGGNNTFYVPVVCYSDSVDKSTGRMSKAMKAYLDRAKEYDLFIKEQWKEFELGKKHLANMMGLKDKDMTQEEIDEAIQYLFPSGLYVPGARPLMKPPNEVFAERKAAEFDISGRPFHYLFYTSKPNFTQVLHDAAQHLDYLNKYETRMIKAGVTTPEKILVLGPGEWLSRDDLKAKFLENVFTIDYERFVEVFERLANHPYGYLVGDFIKSFRTVVKTSKEDEMPVPVVNEDGSRSVTTTMAPRKSSRANVTVTYEGKGNLKINGQGIDYFLDVQAREQILFPLLFTDLLGKVDIEATVESGGETSQAGAIRYGISNGLQCFVSSEMRLKMKVVGLLQRDYRTAERKKPGKKKARRSFTWLKR